MSSAPQATSIARIGRLVGGRYRLDRVLGVGAMGAVYQACDTDSGEPVAVKVLRSENATRPEAVRRFLQEARATAKVVHPNIVRILDLGTDPADGSLFIVQELLVGIGLREELDRCGALAVPRALEIALPIMRALAAAHKQGVVHRDLKPENIFLAVDSTGRGVPKLIDFGGSKLLRALESRSPRAPLTEVGVVVGTPLYMSPEQLRGQPDIDARTDVWAMAVVLYEMLAGRCPYFAGNLLALSEAMARNSARRIDLAVPTVPSELAEVLHAALVAERDRRLPSMQTFVEALVACPPVERELELADRPTAIHWVPPRDRASGAEPTTATPTERTSPARGSTSTSIDEKPARVRTAITVVLMLLMLLLGLLLAVGSG